MEVRGYDRECMGGEVYAWGLNKGKADRFSCDPVRGIVAVRAPLYDTLLIGLRCKPLKQSEQHRKTDTLTKKIISLS